MRQQAARYVQAPYIRNASLFVWNTVIVAVAKMLNIFIRRTYRQQLKWLLKLLTQQDLVKFHSQSSTKPNKTKLIKFKFGEWVGHVVGACTSNPTNAKISCFCLQWNQHNWWIQTVFPKCFSKSVDNAILWLYS